MSLEITNEIIKKIYRQSMRRLFLINLTNNFILISIIGILVFDFSIIIKSTNPQLSANILIILLVAVPLLSIFKTIKDLPSIYYILASVDHKASTRGTFSLLNDLSKKDPENKNLGFLFNKSEQLIKSLSMKSIFPWKFLWNGYLGAALAFTAVLWIAIPQQKITENSNSLSEQTPTEKDISVAKDDPLIKAFLNDKPTPSTSDNKTNTTADKKAIEQNNSNEKEKVIVQDSSEPNNQEKKFEEEIKKEEESKNSLANNKNGGKGSGTEEVKTDKTIEIKNKTLTDSQNNEKINLTEPNNQDGSSKRITNLANETKATPEHKLNAPATAVKMQKMDNLSEMVSSKYQKIIENYFSEE